MLVAPKGAGSTVRSQFLKGTGINVSYAIHQNYTGDAFNKCMIKVPTKNVVEDTTDSLDSSENTEKTSEEKEA